MQESVPIHLVQGSTGETKIAVSVHTGVDGRSCHVCRHPDRSVGSSGLRSLSVTETASRSGLSPEVIQTGMADGSMVITSAIIDQVRVYAPDMAALLVAAAERGKDLCGALGDLRATFGIREGPQEASVPFVSALAGVLAAAEIVKLDLRRQGLLAAPILDNGLELDLARDYSRHNVLSFL